MSSGKCAVTKSDGKRTVTKSNSTIAMTDGVQIDARIYTPDSNPWAAAVFAHGGCFTLGDRDSQEGISLVLASLGIAVVSTSFRQGSAHPHPAARNDLMDVARFATKDLWPSLPLGVVGSSSGGFHALDLAREATSASFKQESSWPIFAFCVAICPVAHPARRASYLQACVAGTTEEEGYAVAHTPEMAADMLRMQKSYWLTEEAMRAAGDALLRKPTGMPPTLMVLGGSDLNVPHEVSAGVQSWATRTVVLGGRGHEVQDAPLAEIASLLAPDLERFVRDAVRQV